MHPDAGMLAKLRADFVRHQVQGSPACKEVRGQSGVGFVHPAPRMKAPGYQNPRREFCLTAFIGDLSKAIGHTSIPELPCQTEPEPQKPAAQKFPFLVGLRSTP